MLVALKVMLAPTLIALCTIVAYRRGEAAGGWLLGLPLISGPVSVLLFLEHGAAFARVAAGGTLLGLVGAVAFCSCYALIASRQPWWRSLLAACVACFATAMALLELHPGFAWTLGIVLLVLATLPWLLWGHRREEPAPERPAPSAQELAVRMAVATLAVFIVTSAANFLGAAVAGMLAPLPVIAAVMAVSLHRERGYRVAGSLLRGTVTGLWGAAAFFAVVGVLMAPGQAAETYTVAICAALAGAFAATRVQGAQEPSSPSERFRCAAVPALSCSWCTPAPASRVRW